MFSGFDSSLNWDYASPTLNSSTQEACPMTEEQVSYSFGSSGFQPQQDLDDLIFGAMAMNPSGNPAAGPAHSGSTSHMPDSTSNTEINDMDFNNMDFSMDFTNSNVDPNPGARSSMATNFAHGVNSQLSSWPEHHATNNPTYGAPDTYPQTSMGGGASTYHQHHLGGAYTTHRAAEGGSEQGSDQYQSDLAPPPAQRLRLNDWDGAALASGPPTGFASGGATANTSNPSASLTGAPIANTTGPVDQPGSLASALGAQPTTAPQPSGNQPNNKGDTASSSKVPFKVEFTISGDIIAELKGSALRLGGHQLLLGLHGSVNDSKAALQVAIDHPSPEMIEGLEQLFETLRQRAHEVKVGNDKGKATAGDIDDEVLALLEGIYAVQLEPDCLHHVSEHVKELELAILNHIIFLFRDKDLLNLRQFDHGRNPDMFRKICSLIATTQFLSHLFLESRQGGMGPGSLDDLGELSVDHPMPGQMLNSTVQTQMIGGSVSTAKVFALHKIAQIEKLAKEAKKKEEEREAAARRKAKGQNPIGEQGKPSGSQEGPTTGAFQEGEGPSTPGPSTNASTSKPAGPSTGEKKARYEEPRHGSDGYLRIAKGDKKNRVGVVANNMSTALFSTLAVFFGHLDSKFKSTLPGAASVLEEFIEDQEKAVAGGPDDVVWRCKATVEGLLYSSLRYIFKRSTLDVTAEEIRGDDHARLTYRCKLATAELNGLKWVKMELKEFLMFRKRSMFMGREIINARKFRAHSSSLIEDAGETIFWPGDAIHIVVEGQSLRALRTQPDSDDDDASGSGPHYPESPAAVAEREANNIETLRKGVPWLRGMPSVDTCLSKLVTVVGSKSAPPSEAASPS